MDNTVKDPFTNSQYKVTDVRTSEGKVLGSSAPTSYGTSTSQNTPVNNDNSGINWGLVIPCSLCLLLILVLAAFFVFRRRRESESESVK